VSGDDGSKQAIATILRFWFGDPQVDDSYQQRRKLWFRKRPQVDQEIRDRFQSLYDRAVAGEFSDWQRSPQGSLALLLLFDQFPRNMFRDSAQAFATDPLALAIAEAAIVQDFDQLLEPIRRIFVYLPLEHSENLDHQRRSVELFRQLHSQHPEFADILDYAIRHQQVIERFGRFPHRNQWLDRPSTPEEMEFLQQPGSSF
jgi:uncharacterized protein (DUF924 family)